MNKINNFNPFSGPELEKVIHTTQSQAEIWTGCKLGGTEANRAYNESISLILEGELDHSALQGALLALVQRHEALRSVFSSDGRFMSIMKFTPLEFDIQDFSQLSFGEKEKSLSNYLLGDANFIFDLAKGPLIKFGLIKTNALEHQLIITAHHIICDGWSFGIMLEELGILYSANVKNEVPNLPKVDHFSSYVDDLITYSGSQEKVKTDNFWIGQYKTSIPELNLPTDFKRPELRTFKSARLDFPIDKELLSKLKKIGIQSGCSFVTTLMSAFEVFLYKQTEQDDIVLGLPSAGQSVTGKTQLIGHCVNLLPLRTKMDVNHSFSEYLKERKVSVFDAYDHQQLSFGELLQKLHLHRDPSRVPLVPVVFNIDMGMTSHVNFSNLKFKVLSNPRTSETFELFLNATGTEDNFILEWSYNSALFTPSTIKQMMDSFKNVLSSIIEKSNITIGEIIKVDDSDYVKLNQTAVSFPQLALHELIGKKAEIFNKKDAIKFENTTISYKELELQANRLSHYFIEQNVKAGDIVAVALPRSIELVVSLIAIMQCGATYLPLDPNYPKKRLEFMLDDSEANILISSKEFSLSLNTKASVLTYEDVFSNLSKYSEKPLPLKVGNNEVAYILYTSGSTGKPKGVSVTHKSLVNFLYSMMKEPGINETDRLLSITTISFDIAGLELFLPLLSGATLVIANDETAKDSRLMLHLLESEKITMLQATPTTWQMLLDAGWEKLLPIKAICGGEMLPLPLSKKILNRVDELWNVYGPTETTIWSTVKQIKKDDELITIGEPIANTQIYILNEKGLLVGSGKTGEICIAGTGVAKGYWKRPELTAEKFVENKFDADFKTKLYRTGDLGKLLPTGDILCLGRIDHQVKIRGHRIELGEIEEALDAEEEIQSSVVLVDSNHLTAFIIPTNLEKFSEDNITKWKKNLFNKLPDYMVPKNYNMVSNFPTTLNGKIDRKSLLENNLSKKTNEADYTAPRNKTEQIVGDIWKEALNLDSIDIFTNFFELGGHSLIAVKVMVNLEKETGTNYPLSSLLEYPTVEQLAKFIDSDSDLSDWSSLTPIKTEGKKDPLYVIHGADHNVLIFETLSRTLDKEQPVYGLQAKGLNGIDEPHDAVEKMALHYVSEILEANPTGPYAIAGYSFGGLIAFEMAKILKAKNKKVKSLIMLDSYVYPTYKYSPSSFRKKRAQLSYTMGQVFFTIKMMLKDKKSFNRWLNIFKLKIKSFTNNSNSTETKEENTKVPWPIELNRIHRSAISKYQISPENFKIDLLKVEDNDVFYAHDTNYLGWEEIAQGGIDRHVIPGNHHNMFRNPNDKKLGKTLQTILDRDNE
ncbi:amino acid adenylation domain-containing protein [Cellulophaga sp. HaHaR_3_176]|uniref:non-ribosomal peptide synthetase n=1 Tax=Cellulophaga sp. HaHaR_3_176 TaxID=1942464 RepID=UPI001C1FFE65|nr:non-ribosomal peptide synthetase [Cellulophaga sp. HaHaR_3_176]QWX82697.1 amino acid adenylation domain-containing protein [Cellulophaga sp. HaHaR_3_176]